MASVITGAVWPTYRNGRLGPYQDSNGNLWVVAYVSSQPTVFKSTDQGVTWDSGTSSGTSGGTDFLDSAFDFANGVIYVLCGTSAQVAQIWKFTISSTTWAQVDAGSGPTVIVGDFPSGNRYAAFINLLSDGSFVIYYQGPLTHEMSAFFSAVYYRTCTSGGTWGTETLIDVLKQADHIVGASVVGASDRVHFVYHNHTTLVAYHRSLSGGVLDTEATLSATNWDIGAYFTAYYPPTLDSVIIGPSIGSANRFFYRSGSIANPTFVADDTNLTNFTSYDTDSGCNISLFYDSTSSKLFAFYHDFTSGDLHYKASADRSWDNDSVIKLATNITVTGISTAGITNGIGIIYCDNTGTVYYTDVDLVIYEPLVIPLAIKLSKLSGSRNRAGLHRLYGPLNKDALPIAGAAYTESATISSVTTVISDEQYVPFIQKPSLQPILTKLAYLSDLHVLRGPLNTDAIAVTGVAYVDSATVTSVTSVQSSESTDFLDTSGAVQGQSSITLTETTDFVEAAAVAGTTTPSSTETTDYVESATITSVTTITSVELFVPFMQEGSIQPLLITLIRYADLHLLRGPLNKDQIVGAIAYTESATITSVTSVQSSESTDFLDTSGAIQGQSSITYTETTDYVDTATVTSVTTLTVQEQLFGWPLIPQPILIKFSRDFIRLHNNILIPADSVRVDYIESATISSVTSVQSSESTDFLDTSGAIQGTSSITSTELAAFVDSATVPGVTTPSTVETTDYVESATVTSVTTPSITDTADFVDNSTVTSITTITIVEALVGAGAVPHPLLITLDLGRLKLFHNFILIPADSVRVDYVESATVSSVTTVASAEVANYVESATIATVTSISVDIATIFNDTFTRTVSSNWGSPDYGPVWSVRSGAASAFSVDGSKSLITPAAAATTYRIRNAINVVDLEVNGKVSISVTPVGANVTSGVESRWQDGTAFCYFLALVYTTGGALQVSLQKRTPSSSTIATAVTIATGLAGGEWFQFRLQNYGNVIRAKVWLDGSGEPSDWTLIALDTDITTSGDVNAFNFQSAGGTNLPTLQFDNMAATLWVETAQYVETTTVSGVTSPSIVETADALESATVASVTTPSIVDTADYVDSSTVASVTSITLVEQVVGGAYIPRALLIKLERGKLKLLSNNILNPADSVRVDYIESATISSVTSVQSSESTDFLDTAGTVQGTSSIAFTELAAFVDASTTAGVTTPSITDTTDYLESATVISASAITLVDTADYIESATVTSVTSITLVEQISAGPPPLQPLLFKLVHYRKMRLLMNYETGTTPPLGVIYSESATIASAISVTSVETTDFVESQTASGTSSITVIETANDVEAATAAGNTNVSISETAQFVESATVSSTTSLTITETTDYVETATTPSVTTPSLTDTADYVDSSTVTSVTTITILEVVYVEPARPHPLLIRLILGLGREKTLTNSDILSPVTPVVYLDSTTVSSTTTPSIVEFAGYLESTTVPSATAPSITDLASDIDSATTTSKTSISYVEVTPTDQSTIPSATLVFTTEITAYVDAASPRLVTSVTADEFQQNNNQDFATVTSTTTLSIYEISPVIIFELAIVNSYRRWGRYVSTNHYDVFGLGRRWLESRL